MTGKYYEELQVGQRFKHSNGRTVTEMDNVLFSMLTMNTQPLHSNQEFASRSEWGQRIVNGVFVLGLVVGLSVPELTEGTIVATLGYDRVAAPHPTFHGDTIYAETEVLEMRESKSRPTAGLVRLKHWGRKPDGTLVIEFERTVMFLKKRSRMRARRAMLYMPGDDWNKINKAISLHVDSICMDIEDGTALNRKAQARITIARALQELNFGKSEKLVRINAVGSGMEAEDLQAVLKQRPDGIVIPKIENAAQIEWASQVIENAELGTGWPVNSIRILVVIETARGILNLKEIAAHPRLDALIFGAEDFAANIGATRSNAGWEVLYARSAVVTHAAAFELQSLDMVCVDFRDLVKLKIESAQGAAMGYSGKQIIHPAQVGPVQEAFTPSQEAIEYARRVVETFDAHQAEGAGAYELDGKMIDMPILKNAQKVLERARAAGKV